MLIDIYPFLRVKLLKNWNLTLQKRNYVIKHFYLF